MLFLHQHFDVARGVVIDGLHCLFIGVTLLYWFSKEHARRPYSIRDKVCASGHHKGFLLGGIH